MRQLVQNLFNETTENKLGVTFRQYSGCHHQTLLKIIWRNFKIHSI